MPFSSTELNSYNTVVGEYTLRQTGINFLSVHPVHSKLSENREKLRNLHKVFCTAGKLLTRPANSCTGGGQEMVELSGAKLIRTLTQILYILLVLYFSIAFAGCYFNLVLHYILKGNIVRFILIHICNYTYYF